MSSSESVASPAPSRRARLRAEMVEEIKAVARRQLVEEGPGSVSLRGIARELGTASSAMFRYFPSYNDLITALVVDASESLADALAQARDAQPIDAHDLRLFAIGLAYRRWALEHTSEFALTHGTPLPRYQAPSEITGPPVARAFEVPLSEYAKAVGAGQADPGRSQVSTDVQIGEDLVDLLGEGISKYPPRLIALMLNARASMMGYITSEVFGRLPDLIADPEALYRAHLRTLMLGMGFDIEGLSSDGRGAARRG